jgi:hypothetical protein
MVTFSQLVWNRTDGPVFQGTLSTCWKKPRERNMIYDRRVKQELPLFWQHCSASLESQEWCMTWTLKARWVMKLVRHTASQRSRHRIWQRAVCVCVCVCVSDRTFTIARHRAQQRPEFSRCLARCLLKIHFNVLPPTKRAFKCSIPFTFSDENFVCTYLLSRGCYTPSSVTSCNKLQSMFFLWSETKFHTHIH